MNEFRTSAMNVNDCHVEEAEVKRSMNLASSADDVLDVLPDASYFFSSSLDNNEIQTKNDSGLPDNNSAENHDGKLSSSTEAYENDLGHEIHQLSHHEGWKESDVDVDDDDKKSTFVSSDDEDDIDTRSETSVHSMQQTISITNAYYSDVDNTKSVDVTNTEILVIYQPKSPATATTRESVESEWDKALQSGKPFTGRADAHVFLPRASASTSSTVKRFRRHAGSQKISSASSTSSHHRRNNSLSSNASTISNQEFFLQSVQEEGTIVESQKTNELVGSSDHGLSAVDSPIATQYDQSSLADSISHLPNTTKSEIAKSEPDSRPSSPKASTRTPSMSVSASLRNARTNNSLHYPTSLQRRPIQLQSRRTTASSIASTSSGLNIPHNGTSVAGAGGVSTSVISSHSYHANDNLSAGVLPDILLSVRQKIESMTLFDSDILKLMSADYKNNGGIDPSDDPSIQESRESLKRSSQQSISASVLVSLAHKRYERRRLAAMEIEKVVRSLVVQHQHQLMKNQQQLSIAKHSNFVLPSPISDMALERIRAILLLLSDDYVRSTSEDARKGGVVALAACAIGLKKADDTSSAVQECRDLILASVVHACQDHSQRVRYYATESLFNVVKVIPSLAVQHFFILFEILRSLYSDVDIDVRSGAELLDKKLKEIIVGAMNAGIFTADACVPVFSRFVFMKHKATKRLTLTWLQELNEKLIGSPILEFLHLFLGGIFDMVADPTVIIRQSALAFLQSVLPRLLVVKHDVETSAGPNNTNTDKTSKGYNSMFDNMEDIEMNVVDFDKILQSLVTTMEHPNPFVRKVAMYWMSRIVKAHMTASNSVAPNIALHEGMMDPNGGNRDRETEMNDNVSRSLSAASIAVRNSVPHVLPGILLSIGDDYHFNPNNNPSGTSMKDSFLPDQTTRDLAEQTNSCLQEAVRRDGSSYVQHLDGFIVALREELDSPGGFTAKNTPAAYRSPYRVDVPLDGTGVESAGWFRSTRDTSTNETRISDDSIVKSRICALNWVIVLYESVVPDFLKADYAREFIFAVIHQLVDTPPSTIVQKSLEVLGKITVPVPGEEKSRQVSSHPLNGFGSPAWTASSLSRINAEYYEDHTDSPMSDANVAYALKFLDPVRRRMMSRDREVFSSLVQLFSCNEYLLADLSNVLTFMCKLQPPAFIMLSFAVELERFIRRHHSATGSPNHILKSDTNKENDDDRQTALARDFRFVSCFIQHMNHVFLNTEEAKELRIALKDCVGDAHKQHGANSEKHRRLSVLFNILLHAFSHNIAATLSLCLWSGAYKTAVTFLSRMNPLDINLVCLLELDRLVEMLERPLFRHLHVRMLEKDQDWCEEHSGSMLLKFLKSLLMILPQSTCYRVLRDRLTSIARFRQSNLSVSRYPSSFDRKRPRSDCSETKGYVDRILDTRKLHCEATWKSIRQGSLETKLEQQNIVNSISARLEWLGYKSKEEEDAVVKSFRDERSRSTNIDKIEDITNDYSDLDAIKDGSTKMNEYNIANVEVDQLEQESTDQGSPRWLQYWMNNEK